MLVSLVLESIYKIIGQGTMGIKNHSLLDLVRLLSSVIENITNFFLPVCYCHEITSWMIWHISKGSSINVMLAGDKHSSKKIVSQYLLSSSKEEYGTMEYTERKLSSKPTPEVIY